MPYNTYFQDIVTGKFIIIITIINKKGWGKLREIQENWHWFGKSGPGLISSWGKWTKADLKLGKSDPGLISGWGKWTEADLKLGQSYPGLISGWGKLREIQENWHWFGKSNPGLISGWGKVIRG